MDKVDREYKVDRKDVNMVELVDEVDMVDNLDKDKVDNFFFLGQFPGTPPTFSRSFPTHTDK